MEDFHASARERVRECMLLRAAEVAEKVKPIKSVMARMILDRVGDKPVTRFGREKFGHRKKEQKISQRVEPFVKGRLDSDAENTLLIAFEKTEESEFSCYYVDDRAYPLEESGRMIRKYILCGKYDYRLNDIDQNFLEPEGYLGVNPYQTLCVLLSIDYTELENSLPLEWRNLLLALRIEDEYSRYLDVERDVEEIRIELVLFDAGTPKFSFRSRPNIESNLRFASELLHKYETKIATYLAQLGDTEIPEMNLEQIMAAFRVEEI